MGYSFDPVRAYQAAVQAPGHVQAAWAAVAFIVLLALYLGPISTSLTGFSNLRGPPPGNFIKGNVQDIIDAPPLAIHREWVKKYGHTYRYRLIFNSQRLYTQDPLALSHILAHPDIFPKPPAVRNTLAEMLGEGVLVAEGHDHKRQRRILNSSFSHASIREMMPIFFDKAYELRDVIANVIEDETLVSSPTPAIEIDKVPGGRKIDVLKYLGQSTLDVIGIAGFGYDFQSLSKAKNQLAAAYAEMFAAGQSVDFMAIAQSLIPALKFIPTVRQRAIRRAKKITQAVGRQLVEDKKRAVEASHAHGLEKKSDIGKDLLSILIKANMASDLRPEQRLDDDEVLAQITTFMLAGNETTSTALTWVLYLLSQKPEYQDRLRKEVQGITDERISMDEINALPFLDAVVRESLRLLAPAPGTVRQATQTDVIPLSTPVQDRNGKMVDSVTVRKGAAIFVPILNVNTAKEIWGEDADQFNPDRYLKVVSKEQDKTQQIPGIWGNTLTFLGGTRNCIGYRFALVEMKTMLFVLLRSFTFDELPSKPVIEQKASVVMRSRVVGEETAGLQMPLLVKPLTN